VNTAQYFDKRSAEWEELYAKDTRFVRRFEVLTAFIEKQLSKHKASNALDYGCGTGLYSRWLASKGIEVRGLDVSSEMLRRATELTQSGVKYDLAFKQAITAGAPYDLAISLSVFEYIPDWQELLSTIVGSLSPHGMLIVSIPNVKGGVRRLESIAARLQRSSNGKVLQGRGDYLEHQLWQLTSEQFDAEVAKLGLKKIDQVYYNAAFNMPKPLLSLFEKPWWAALYAGAYVKR
jgi:2-polyprenyl-3-methyl-5-hydroxy-6-metoxy-1,4-benzoquinol methylase